jgi:hypothetical protein
MCHRLQFKCMKFFNVIDGIQFNLTTNHNEAYIQGLLKFANYTVEVGGYCSQGMGPLSSAIICTTMQDREYLLPTSST